ncbi:MAG: hypothetical protein R2688_03020 [Fimbriimonadaceae bacterium]
MITEGVPVNDMLHVANKVKANGKSQLLGGNCAGIITPGECKMGIMPVTSLPLARLDWFALAP